MQAIKVRMDTGTTLTIRRSTLKMLPGHMWFGSWVSYRGQYFHFHFVVFLAAKMSSSGTNIPFGVSGTALCGWKMTALTIFFSKHNKQLKRETNTIGYDSLTGHTYLLAMMHPDLTCIKESSVVAFLSEMLLVQSSKIKIISGLYW